MLHHPRFPSDNEIPKLLSSKEAHGIRRRRQRIKRTFRARRGVSAGGRSLHFPVSLFRACELVFSFTKIDRLLPAPVFRSLFMAALRSESSGGGVLHRFRAFNSPSGGQPLSIGVISGVPIAGLFYRVAQQALFAVLHHCRGAAASRQMAVGPIWRTILTCG